MMTAPAIATSGPPAVVRQTTVQSFRNLVDANVGRRENCAGADFWIAMFRHTVAIATIAVLLACPVLCSMGAGVESSGQAPHCCGHCHSVPADEPAEPISPNDGTCCLCKGAVTERAVCLLDLSGGFSLDAVTPAVALNDCDIASARPLVTRVDVEPLPLAGRLLRLEHCALTC
jgi:hypothetical protein